MTTQSRYLHALRRRLGLMQLPLPTEFFTFPVGLVLSLFLSPLLALLGAALGLGLGILLLWLVGGLAANRPSVGRSLFVLLLWATLALSFDDFYEHPLWLQSLLLFSYITSSLVAGIYRWGRDRWGTLSCGCLRSRILREERLRFERILIAFSLATLCAISACVHLCPVEWGALLQYFAIFVALFTWGVYAFESLHLLWVNKRLDREQWIPVVGDQQQQLGRVPLTDARSDQGRLPVVRLMATTGDMLYLEHSEREQLPIAAGYDTPFVSWLTEGCRPEALAQLLIDQRFCGVRRARPRFLLHYHETLEGQPLSVYLYAVDIAEPSQLLVDCQPQQGRWWPLEHITAQLEQLDFAPYLRAELPYLEQTILLAQRLRQGASL